LQNIATRNFTRNSLRTLAQPVGDVGWWTIVADVYRLLAHFVTDQAASRSATDRRQTRAADSRAGRRADTGADRGIATLSRHATARRQTRDENRDHRTRSDSLQRFHDLAPYS
jgi:hypothetical protein